MEVTRVDRLEPDIATEVDADRDGWEADWRLRMRNAEWLTLTLIEATLVWITHRVRRCANVR
jgi:hypothetical protein